MESCVSSLERKFQVIGTSGSLGLPPELGHRLKGHNDSFPGEGAWIVPGGKVYRWGREIGGHSRAFAGSQSSDSSGSHRAWAILRFVDDGWHSGFLVLCPALCDPKL